MQVYRYTQGMLLHSPLGFILVFSGGKKFEKQGGG
jgi:hypothetical protein